MLTRSSSAVAVTLLAAKLGPLLAGALLMVSARGGHDFP